MKRENECLGKLCIGLVLLSAPTKSVFLEISLTIMNEKENVFCVMHTISAEKREVVYYSRYNLQKYSIPNMKLAYKFI